MAIDRTFTFMNGADTIDPYQLEVEIQGLADAFNNLVVSGVATYSTDITITTGGKGLILKTPNGLHTYRLSIDNDGSIVTEQLT